MMAETGNTSDAYAHARFDVSQDATGGRPTIRLDLTEDATRETLLDGFRGLLTDDQRAVLERTVRGAGVDGEHYHDLAAVLSALDGARLDEHVADRVRAVYRTLGHAEASVHGCPVEHTHFHEVGDGDTVRACIEVCLAVALLDPAEIVSTPVQVGSGTVVCAHGELPVPAPATATILSDDIPRCTRLLAGERCTPTSAALVRCLVDRFEEEV